MERSSVRDFAKEWGEQRLDLLDVVDPDEFFAKLAGARESFAVPAEMFSHLGEPGDRTAFLKNAGMLQRSLKALQRRARILRNRQRLTLAQRLSEDRFVPEDPWIPQRGAP